MNLENLFRRMVGQDPVEPCVEARHGMRHPSHTWTDFAWYDKGGVEPRKKKFYCKGVR